MSRMFIGVSPSSEEQQPLRPAQRHTTPFESSSSLDDDDIHPPSPTPAGWLLHETQAVSLWSCASFLLRILVGILLGIATWQEEMLNSESLWSVKALSMVARFLSHCLPARVLTNQCPAFFFSNAAILLWVRDKTGVFSNFPVKCCEYMMGRIGLRDLAAVVPIHFFTFYCVGFLVQRVLPSWIASLALENNEYDSDGDGNPWIVDLSRQVFATAVFSVSILVVPVLLRLNKIPQFTVIFLMYPLYQYSAGKTGVGDFFSPNALASLDLLRGQGMPALWRMLGTTIGGLVSGLVMNAYFPDEGADKHIKNNSKWK